MRSRRLPPLCAPPLPLRRRPPRRIPSDGSFTRSGRHASPGPESPGLKTWRATGELTDIDHAAPEALNIGAHTPAQGVNVHACGVGGERLELRESERQHALGAAPQLLAQLVVPHRNLHQTYDQLPELGRNHVQPVFEHLVCFEKPPGIELPRRRNEKLAQRIGRGHGLLVTQRDAVVRTPQSTRASESLMRNGCCSGLMLVSEMLIATCAALGMAATSMEQPGISQENYGGWAHTYRLRKGRIEVSVVTDIGPRIIDLRVPGGNNLLHLRDGIGGSGEPSYMFRGGWRLWVAPERTQTTYALDNTACQAEVDGATLRVTAPPQPAAGIQKRIEVSLTAGEPRVRIVSRVRNISDR